jgi:hypothetical protein
LFVGNRQCVIGFHYLLSKEGQWITTNESYDDERPINYFVTFFLLATVFRLPFRVRELFFVC